MQEQISDSKGEALFKSFGDGSKLDKLPQHLAGGNQTVNYLSQGLNKSKEIFADKADEKIEKIAIASGLKKFSVSSLLGVVTPMLLGLLGKQKVNGLDLANFSSILNSQTEALSKFINATEIIQEPSTDHTINSTKPTDKPLSPIDKNSELKVGSDITKSKTPVFLKYLIPLFLIAAIAYFVKDPFFKFISTKFLGKTPVVQPSDTTEKQVTTLNPQDPLIIKNDSNTEKQSPSSLQNITDSQATKEEKLAKMGKVIDNQIHFLLPGGNNIALPINSFESKLLKGLNSNDLSVLDKPYILNRTYFASGSSELTDESRNQIISLASILNSYPDLKILLRGHTDSVGTVDKNLAISTQRAQSVKDALVRFAVNKESINILGRGPADPIADNKTAKGRAQNRRIDITVSQ